MSEVKKQQGYRMISLREKVFFTILILVVYRLLAHIPLPFVNAEYMKAMIDKNTALSFFNALTGGSFEAMSWMALGVGPYITASIVLQLMSVVIPRLADLQKEGATGRQFIERLTLVLGGALGFLQAVVMTWGYGKQGLLVDYTWYTVLIPAVLMTLGVFVLSFAGQLITEKFFGNGISLILLTGIVATYFADANSLYTVLAKGRSMEMGVLLCSIACVVVFLLFGFSFYLNFCEKKIPVTYSQKLSTSYGTQKQTSVIPLKLLSGSVVPIIFASTILAIPGFIQSFTGKQIAWFAIFDSGQWFQADKPWASIGVVLYCLMIVWFSYYYNHLNLNEVELAQNLKKQGGYICGVRPGKETCDYLKSQLRAMAFLGSLGLCVIALIPVLIMNFLHIPRLAFLGTSIIITVSVLVETQSRFATEYDSFGWNHKRSVSMKRSVFGTTTKKKGGTK